MRHKILIVVLVLFGFIYSVDVSLAQNVTNHTVSGVVVDKSNGEFLTGVNITVRGATIGTATDSKGQYQLTIPSSNDTLVFSFIGYQTQVVPVNGRGNIDVEMVPKAVIGEELVVTGYQVQQKSDLTGSVAVVDVENIEEATSGNAVKALQGRVSGVYITTDGSPDSRASVVIRGYNTLGNNEPLYIVDGIPTSSDIVWTLNPQSIKSMQVLKSASAASIYGSRASNGVVIITTKNGSPGTFTVNYSGQLTTQFYVTKLDPLTTLQRGRVLWRAAMYDNVSPDNAIYDYEWHTNNNGTPVLDRVIVPEWLSKEQGIRTANTNWYDAISRLGIIQSHNLSVSMGNKRGSAYLGLRYYGNEGIIKETDYSLLQARINSTYSFFNDRLEIGENLTISKERESPMPSGLGGTPMWLAMIVQPIIPIHTVDGGWGGPVGAGFGDRDNPVRLLEMSRWDQNNNLRIFGNLFAKVDLMESLTLTTRFGVDFSEYYSRNMQRRYKTGFLERNVNSLTTIQNHSISWTWNSTLNYVKDFDQHHVDFMVGIEMFHNVFSEISTYASEFAIESPAYFYNDAATGVKNIGGYRTGYSLMSYFGKVNYNYADKYLGSITLRYDGSSHFGDKNKFGLFPAISMGWRISEEPFFNNNIEFISNLKIRFGWGRTGNQKIANDAIYSIYVPNYGDDPTWGASNGTAYDLGGKDTGNLPSGFLRTQIGNNRLTWETTTEYNIGLDFGLFDQKLTGSFDYFVRHTKDILIRPPFLAAIGYGGGQWVNGASVKNKGLEFSLTYKNSFGNFNYRITANISRFRDEVTYLPPSVVDGYPGNGVKTILGHSQKAIFGYVANGLFDSKEEVQNHAEQPGAAPGRIRYKDLNGDGAITPLDQKFIGVSIPDIMYGLGANLSYNSFTFSFFLQGIQGIEVYNSRKTYTDFTSMWNGTNYGNRTLRAWTPTNKNSSIPALTLADTNNEDRPSTYFVEDGSYLKVRKVQIGYTFHSNVLKYLNISNLKIYILGENIFTFKNNSGKDKYTGADPENPGNVYPIPRKITFGINISF